MGDGENASLRLQFNPKVRLEFHGSTITSDAGLLAFREFDDALGLTEIAEDYLQESRTGRNILHHLVPLLRQSIYSRLAGYDDTNDAVRLSQDPAMRVIVGWQGSERKGASTSEMGRFETEFLTQEDNLKGLARINTQWVERAMAHTLHRRVILDMDSSESPVHGQQEGAAYNGHFECVCYHPLFLFNQFGDCEAAKLRSGNVHSADDWQEVLDPVVERYLTAAVRLLFRADAAFAKPEIYDYLEARNIGYAIRLRSNQVLQREIAHRLIRPTEWLSPKPIVSYHDFVYQAQSWNVARRVVSKVEWHQGELFPRVGFIVTNLSYPNIGIVRFYNGRGTAEQWINPNPPKDTDGRREESGRGGEGATGEIAWVPFGVGRSADGLHRRTGAPMTVCGSCDARDGERIRSRELSRTGLARVCGDLRLSGGWVADGAVRPGVEWLAAGPRRG